MIPTWKGQELPQGRIGVGGGVRALGRSIGVFALIYSGLALFMILRLYEKIFRNRRRSVTPYIVQGVCRGALFIMGFRLKVSGQPMRELGAIMSNHVSWLDIFVIGAVVRGFFVAKAEVSSWAVIGLLARVTGTLFIRRRSIEAKNHKALLETHLNNGDLLIIFPEGTSTDAIRVLPFKSTLFEAVLNHNSAHTLSIQPVSLVYHAPKGQDPRYYGWWGDMGFVSNFIKITATPHQGTLEIIFHPTLNVSEFSKRKELAAACEMQVRQGLQLSLGETVD